MKKLLMAVAVALLPMVGFAQDFDKGSAAAQSGDFATAIKEWKPLADQGHAFAQAGLGLMYESGAGVPQDYAEAVRWYRLAADQGDALAQYNLAGMYRKGRGVIQNNQTEHMWYNLWYNLQMAHMWYNLASANGSESSGKWRDELAEKMTPASIEEAQRRAKVCMASNYKDCD